MEKPSYWISICVGSLATQSCVFVTCYLLLITYYLLLVTYYLLLIAVVLSCVLSGISGAVHLS
jgi:hypothetical protein